MRGGALPPALLGAALAFALAFAPPRIFLMALIMFVLVAICTAFIAVRHSLQEVVFLGCWASVIGTALMVHVPKKLNQRFALLLAVNDGVWAGATIAVAGAPKDLALALPALLLVIPSWWLVQHRAAIAIKVVASWLVAVSILAATLPIVPTPGYVADHME